MEGLGEVVFSSHALRRMRERGISREDVLEALRRPVQSYYDYSKDVYLVLGENRVGVVYSYRAPRVEVVTVLRESEYRGLVVRIGRRRYKPVDV